MKCVEDECLRSPPISLHWNKPVTKVVHVVCITGNPHNPARSPHVIPLGMHDTGLTVEIKEMRGYGTKMANRPMMSQDSVID